MSKNKFHVGQALLLKYQGKTTCLGIVAEVLCYDDEYHYRMWYGPDKDTSVTKEKDLVRIENEDSFNIIRISNDFESIGQCPARKLATQIIESIDECFTNNVSENITDELNRSINSMFDFLRGVEYDDDGMQVSDGPVYYELEDLITDILNKHETQLKVNNLRNN
jgi:hypothetical protein